MFAGNLNGTEATFSTVRIRALGGLSASNGQGNLDGEWIDGDAGALLRFLVAHRGMPVGAQSIIDALWPGAGITRLKTAIEALKDALDPARRPGMGIDLIVGVRGGLELHPAVQIDIDDFEQAAHEGMAAEGVEALYLLRSAAALYGGTLFGERLPYAADETDRLASIAADVQQGLAHDRMTVRRVAPGHVTGERRRSRFGRSRTLQAA